MSVYHEVIECIPSSALRNYLMTHEVNLSVMQMATIVSECAVRKKQAALFRKLRDIAGSEAERLLLDTEITDTNAACEVYRDNFPHEGFPLFPFLEVCNLPVLFKSGDVIRSHEKFYNDNLYCVGIAPVLLEPGRCYFSDECYFVLSVVVSCQSSEGFGIVSCSHKYLLCGQGFGSQIDEEANNESGENQRAY